MRQLFFLFIYMFLFVNVETYAQPGGGGGLNIFNFYNKKLEEINLSTDSLKIRTFALTNENVFKETYINYDSPKKRDKGSIHRRDSKFYLPDSRSLVDRAYNYHNNNETIDRMYILYKKDSMIVDFVGVEGANANGLILGIDSLVIQKGYFKFYCNRMVREKEDIDINESAKKRLLYNGLTINTVKHLKNGDFLEYKPHIDLSFLSSEYRYIPNSYYINYAFHYLENNEINRAFDEIDKAIKNNGGEKNCEILYANYEIYSRISQYDKALENITQAIKKDCYDWYKKINNYEKRIELYMKLDQYHKALEDYNSLVTFAIDEDETKTKRANFKLTYFKKYDEVINDMRSVINRIPESYLNTSFGVPSCYEYYFILAMAEYLKGDKKSAYRHWIMAEDYKDTSTNREDKLSDYNVIIQSQPNVPELYLARGIAFYKIAEQRYGDEAYYQSINDLNKARELGLGDYRINLYLANSLRRIKKYDEAIKEIDIAISKNAKVPELFFIRSNIQQSITPNVNVNSSDYIKYKELLETYTRDRF